MDEIVFEPSDVNMLAALGIVESVKLFPFMLSMGELQYACDSEYRCKQFVLLVGLMPVPVLVAANAVVGNRLRIVITSKNAETSLVLIDFIRDLLHL